VKVEKDGRGLDPHIKLRHDGFWSEMYACFGGRSYAQFASIPLFVSPPCLLLSTPNLITKYSSMFADSQVIQTKAHLFLHPSDDISPPCRHTTNLCFVLGKSKNPKPSRSLALTRKKKCLSHPQ
jgi:hypothetical protein